MIIGYIGAGLFMLGLILIGSFPYISGALALVGSLMMIYRMFTDPNDCEECD